MIFISYIQRDEAFADFLAEKLISLGVEVFRMPSSVDAGQKWLDSLRNGLTTCDEALGVMSYKAFERPWIPAEWAAFWVPGKRYTPILLGIESDGLWQPIGASQAVHASNSDELEGLLGRLVGSDSTKYDPRIIRAARLISEHHDVQAGAGEQALGRIVRNLPMGADNIDPNDVDLLCDLGQLPQLIQATASPSAGSVKLRQIAAELTMRRHFTEALALIERCDNRNERLNAVRPFVPELSSPMRKDERDFLAAVVSVLGPPQKRILAQLLRDSDIDPAEIGLP